MLPAFVVFACFPTCCNNSAERIQTFVVGWKKKPYAIAYLLVSLMIHTFPVDYRGKETRLHHRRGRFDQSSSWDDVGWGVGSDHRPLGLTPWDRARFRVCSELGLCDLEVVKMLRRTLHCRAVGLFFFIIVVVVVVEGKLHSWDWWKSYVRVRKYEVQCTNSSR